MVRHIVMWTLKDEAEGQTAKENGAKMKEILEALKGASRDSGISRSARTSWPPTPSVM